MMEWFQVDNPESHPDHNGSQWELVRAGGTDRAFVLIARIHEDVLRVRHWSYRGRLPAIYLPAVW